MMFGQLVFAELPFADHGGMPVLDIDWHEVNQKPCGDPIWNKKVASCRRLRLAEPPQLNGISLNELQRDY